MNTETDLRNALRGAAGRAPKYQPIALNASRTSHPRRGVAVAAAVALLAAAGMSALALEHSSQSRTVDQTAVEPGSSAAASAAQASHDPASPPTSVASISASALDQLETAARLQLEVPPSSSATPPIDGSAAASAAAAGLGTTAGATQEGLYVQTLTSYPAGDPANGAPATSTRLIWIVLFPPAEATGHGPGPFAGGSSSATTESVTPVAIVDAETGKLLGGTSF